MIENVSTQNTWRGQLKPWGGLAGSPSIYSIINVITVFSLVITLVHKLCVTCSRNSKEIAETTFRMLSCQRNRSHKWGGDKDTDMYDVGSSYSGVYLEGMIGDDVTGSGRGRSECLQVWNSVNWLRGCISECVNHHLFFLFFLPQIEGEEDCWNTRRQQ